MATTMTRKGQVTVPKKVREYLGLKAGSSVLFERLASGEIVLRPAKRRSERARERLREASGSGDCEDEDRRDTDSDPRPLRQ